MTDRRNYSYYTDGSAARKIERRPETHTREVSEHSRKYSAIRRRRFNAVLFKVRLLISALIMMRHIKRLMHLLTLKPYIIRQQRNLEWFLLIKDRFTNIRIRKATG